MARPWGTRRLLWLCAPTLLALHVALAAGAETPAGSAPAAPLSPSAPAPVAPTAPVAPGAPITPGILPGTPITPGAATTPGAVPVAPGTVPPPSGPLSMPGAPLSTPAPAPPGAGVPVPPAPGPTVLPASPLTPIPETAGPSSPSGGGPLGPFRFSQPVVDFGAPVQVTATATVEEEYTDNVNETKTNRQSQFRTNFYPGLGAFLDRTASSFYGLYAPRITYLNTNVDGSDNPAIDHNLTARGRWKPTGQLQIDAAEVYTNSSNFQDLQNLGSRQVGTQRYTSNTGTIGAAWLPPQGRLGLSYTNVLSEPGGINPDNGFTHIVRPDFAIRNPRWELAGNYAMTRATYDISTPYWEHSGEARLSRFLTPSFTAALSGLVTSHLPDDSSTVSFMIERLRLAGTWTASPVTFFDGAIGVDRFDPNNSSPKMRPSASLGLTHRFPLFDLAARYEAGFQEQFQDVLNTGATFTQAASVLLRLTAYRNLLATLAIRWTQNDFQLSTANVGANTTDRTWNLEMGVRYTLLRPLFLTFNYALLLRDSTAPGVGFTENRVRVGLTYAFTFI